MLGGRGGGRQLKKKIKTYTGNCYRGGWQVQGALVCQDQKKGTTKETLWWVRTSDSLIKRSGWTKLSLDNWKKPHKRRS